LRDAEWMPAESLFQICKTDQISGAETESFRTRLKFHIGITFYRFIQVELQDSGCLIEIRNPKRIYCCADFLTSFRYIARVDHRIAVLLILIECILKFRGKPIRAIGCVARP